MIRWVERKPIYGPVAQEGFIDKIMYFNITSVSSANGFCLRSFLPGEEKSHYDISVERCKSMAEEMFEKWVGK